MLVDRKLPTVARDHCSTQNKPRESSRAKLHIAVIQAFSLSHQSQVIICYRKSLLLGKTLKLMELQQG